VVQAEVVGGGRPEVTSAEHAEIKRLKAENRRLQEDFAILRAATTFFASTPSLGLPGRGSLVLCCLSALPVGCRPLCGSDQVSSSSRAGGRVR